MKKVLTLLSQTLLVSIIYSHVSISLAKKIEFSGSSGYQARGFLENPLYADQLSGVQSSVFFDLQWEWESDDRKNQATFSPYLRIDSDDDERTHGDIREAYWRHIVSDYEFLIGIDKVFWGVTESRHLVNIINQVDAVENIDEEDYLGQPMINLGVQKNYGRFDLYILPYFRERTFPGKEGRLRGPIVVDTDNPRYDASNEEKHIDFALRYSHYIGDWDIGLSAFHGTSREPLLLFDDTSNRLIPYYQNISQFGLDLQYTTEGWLWKFESIIRKTQDETFEALVGGFEYTFYQVFESDIDIGTLAEYLYDNRDENAPLTTADDDIFLGSRLTFNDTQDTAILAGAIIDTHDQSTGLRLEAERRIGNGWKIELESQWFTNVDENNSSSSFQDDDFILLTISKFW